VILKSEAEAQRSLDFAVGTPLSEIELRVIKETLKHTKGDKGLAAQLLGISTRTIYRSSTASSVRRWHRRERLIAVPARSLWSLCQVRQLVLVVRAKVANGLFSTDKKAWIFHG